MKLHGDRKRQSGPQHLEKYPAKYSGSSKSKYSQSYKDRRSDVPEKATSHRINDEAAPSKHLWVGNVSTSVTKTMLAEQFSRFGDVESIKLFSSKNYAFVTLKTVEDAVYAKKGLHGTVFGGLAIRIEFAKGVNYSHIDEKSMSEKEKQTEERIISQEQGRKDGMAVSEEKKAVPMKEVNAEDRSRQSPEISKGNRNCESSEVLWIGFPLHLKIDEKKLHKLFAPFGGVEKITTFPGRTYAFVRFQNVKAASRAKDALQGKLFNDPRVSISFAKSEVGPVDHYQGTSEIHPMSPLKSQAGSRTAPSRNKEEGASMFTSNSPAKLEEKTSNLSFVSPQEDQDLVLPSTVPLSNFSNAIGFRDENKTGIDSERSASSFTTSGSGRGVNEKPYSPPHPGIQPKLSSDVKGDFSENAGFMRGPKLEAEKGMPVFRKDDFSERMDTKSESRWMPLEDYGNKREQKRGRLELEYPASVTLSSVGSGSDKSRVQVDDGEAKRQRLGDQHFWGDGAINIGANSNLNDHRTYLSSHETWDEQTGQKQDLERRTLSPSNNQGITVPLGSEEHWDGKEGSQQGLPGRMPLPDSNVDQSVVYKNEHGLVESPISPPPPDVDSPIFPPPKDVFRWEGVIAKGGIEVCHCRCFPATKEIDVMFPDILNYTERTSLDKLAKYISQVMEFSVVLFMPQGVPDVAPYQELMAFLADKQRAAVCKLSEENTLFLVPPSDFVEQFLNVPKSNNILGVVLGLKQQSKPFHALSEQQASYPKQMFLVNELKKQSLQRIDVCGSLEGNATSMVMPAHSSTELKTTLPPSSQSILYQLTQVEGSNKDPAVPTAFQNFSAKSLVGQDKPQDHDVAIDNGRMVYQTHGSKSFPLEYQLHENNPKPDNQSVPYQIPGNNPIPHGLTMFGGSSLPLGSKLLPPHQDPGMPSRPFMPQTVHFSEQLSVPGSSQRTADCQQLLSSFPFREQLWAAPPVVPPHSTPLTQLNAPLAHLQQSCTYGSTHSQQHFPLFDGGQQDGQIQSSNFTFKSGAVNSRNMLLPYPPIPEPGVQPPVPLPGPPPLESGLRPPGPASGPQPPSFQVKDKLGMETEQQQALQMALEEIQDQEGLDEDQKKFRATVELAAALLQQLQKQTKL